MSLLLVLMLGWGVSVFLCLCSVWCRWWCLLGELFVSRVVSFLVSVVLFLLDW